MASLFDNKTPKTVVMEVCAKKRLVANWDAEEVQKVPPVFKIVCRVIESGRVITTEGHGSTKKEAEQSAALKLISQITTTAELIHMTGAWKQITADERNVMLSIKASDEGRMDGDPVSDTDDDQITGEPIGQLITTCARFKLENPKYSDSELKNAENKSIFKVSASVGSLSTHTGRRFTKQQAKKIAAFRVLRDLKGQGFNIEDKTKKGKPTTGTTPGKPSSEVTSSQEPPKPSNITLEIESDHDSNDTTDAGPSSSVTLLQKAGKRSPEVTDSASNEQSEQHDVGTPQHMEIDEDNGFAKVKRKLEEEEEELGVPSSSSPTDIKRKYELLCGQKLTCDNQSENCLRFIKDYAHVFQHLPPNPHLDEALMPKEFQLLLKQHGSAVKLLEKSVAELNAKLCFSYSPIPLNTNSVENRLVILTIKLDVNNNEFKKGFQNKQTVFGVGESKEEAKENAALNALKHFRLMMFSDPDD